MVINARKKSKRRFQLKQAQPLLSSQDIFCEGKTIKSGETGTKRKVKSLASWPFLFQERSFKTFDQQTTVLRSVKEKPGINVWLFCVLRGGCVYTKGIPVQRT
ncbi:hypothetical protein [Leptospira interrogans]|uniref:hypothetical protein n=1 Tax=Leptospira interrogans TaxID=173 RepID=UPI00046C51B2|nr:hypothetical protein [Leptospira interrogans]